MTAFTQMGPADAAYPYASAPQTSSDATLIERIAGGDQLAMRTLFARHRVQVYRFVLRIVRDAALADDLVSDVFLDVWRQAAEFQSRSSVSTWLLAIARYKSLSALRRPVAAALDEAVAASVPDPADNPEIVLQKKDRSEVLRRSLAELPPDHAEVIDLVYYHGKSVAEAASIIGIPQATVKTRMFYARKNLAELVKAA